MPQCGINNQSFLTDPLGTVRLSPGYFNTVEQMDATLQALERIAGTAAPEVSGSHEKLKVGS